MKYKHFISILTDCQTITDEDGNQIQTFTFDNVLILPNDPGYSPPANIPKDANGCLQGLQTWCDISKTCMTNRDHDTDCKSDAFALSTSTCDGMYWNQLNGLKEDACKRAAAVM